MHDMMKVAVAVALGLSIYCTVKVMALPSGLYKRPTPDLTT